MKQNLMREPSAIAQMKLIHVLARESDHWIPPRDYKRLQRGTAADRSEFITTLQFKRDLRELLAGKRMQGDATKTQILYWIDVRERCNTRPTMDEVSQKWMLSTSEMQAAISEAMKAFNDLCDQQGRDVNEWRQARGLYDDEVRREAHRLQVQKKNQRQEERRGAIKLAEKAAILAWRIEGPDDLKAQQRAYKHWESKWVHPYDRHK
ncbi:hypothetical protein [Curtobacterium sp. MCLR17_044]|uniref:hypothetical protein n=1 Tax=Curtobacterium sp. MCLR17_044 TaxID=2175628 RepID=UPI000DA99319|nr:hypothetical protein [Curtobacterium sp. MCLR17_044]PZE57497.1 hypothetical protein DEJ04_10870 [Curtobacterium sp. MCLR17_044]